VALFGRRRVPARAVPAALARPEKALRAERNDHGFLADDGLTINFEGYDLFDTNGTQLDVQHGFGAMEVVAGVWVSRVAGLSHYPAAARSPALKPLEEALLRHEPDNAIDPNAVSIRLADGQLAGHVPADVAPIVRTLMLPETWGVARILGVYSLARKGPIGIRLLIPFGADLMLTVHDPD
jgi:hypothetical protein